MRLNVARMLLVPVAAMTMAAVPAEAPQIAIIQAMTDSAVGWSTGDLDRFMAVYAADAVYVTSKGLVRGKDAIGARYRPSFTGKDNSRGRLAFTDTSFRAIDATHEMLWAMWHLQPSDPAVKASSGWTTLLFERRADGWKIISDHSS